MIDEAGGRLLNRVEEVAEVVVVPEELVAFEIVLLALEGGEASEVVMEAECTQNSQSTNIRNKMEKKQNK